MTDTDTQVLNRVSERPAHEPDLPAALASAAPLRWRNRATAPLACLVLLACGFLGGVAVQRQWGKAPAPLAADPASRPVGGVPSAGPVPAPSGENGPAPLVSGGNGPAPLVNGENGPAPLSSAGNPFEPPATSGILRSVTADTLTLQTPTGGTVTVKIVAATKVQQATTAAALRTGRSVTVHGSTTPDGVITATEVSGS